MLSWIESEDVYPVTGETSYGMRVSLFLFISNIKKTNAAVNNNGRRCFVLSCLSLSTVGPGREGTHRSSGQSPVILRFYTFT